MQFAGVPPAAAPLTTGHPLGLPAVQDNSRKETTVQPVTKQSKADTQANTDGKPPSSFWRGLAGSPDPANHVAPPSIMQIKISAILEEQAERLLDEAKRVAAQEAAAEDAASAEADAAASDATAETEAPQADDAAAFSSDPQPPDDVERGEETERPE